MCFAAAALGGCMPSGNVCGYVDEPVVRPDGGVYRCARSEDCPRGSGDFVCVTDGEFEQACVICVETECVRRVPVRCR